MVENQEESRIYSVSKPDIKCCAKYCSSGEKDNSEKFFFSFPSIKGLNKKQVQRCRTWVQNAGNVDLLLCKSNQLADKFYLCCRHFLDWTAVDSTRIYIDSHAVPTYFDCPPLSNAAMSSFPVTSNIIKEPDKSDTFDGVQTLKDLNGNPKLNQTKTNAANIQIDCIKTEKQDVTADTDVKSPKPQDQTSIETDPLSKKNTHQQTLVEEGAAAEKSSSPQNCTPEKNSRRPSRKAKQDAVKRMSNQLTVNKDIEEHEPPPKLSRSSTDSNDKNSSSLEFDIEEPERSSAKSSIVSNDILSKLGATVPQKIKRKTSGCRVFMGDSVSHNASQPPHNVKILKTGQMRPLAKTDWNLGRSPQIASAWDGEPTGSSSESGVMPILRTIATQTNSGSRDKKCEILNILNSDKKLQVFSGIPSFDVLDRLSDATLKMVMNDAAMICDTMPTMREWIILTCTKFMLGISVEALSVMFEMPEEECRRIVSKTCLFLRKTLSLQDCQKYVWVLPNELLFGIADFSDDVLSGS